MSRLKLPTALHVLASDVMKCIQFEFLELAYIDTCQWEAFRENVDVIELCRNDHKGEKHWETTPLRSALPFCNAPCSNRHNALVLKGKGCGTRLPNRVKLISTSYIGIAKTFIRTQYKCCRTFVSIQQAVFQLCRFYRTSSYNIGTWIMHENTCDNLLLTPPMTGNCCVRAWLFHADKINSFSILICLHLPICLKDHVAGLIRSI